MSDSENNPEGVPEMNTDTGAISFDFSAYPPDTLFHDRRAGVPRSGPARARKERRRRVDPTTFEKQYTPDELEFMNAMQSFKLESGKSFPSHGEVLRVAHDLGYRRDDV